MKSEFHQYNAKSIQYVYKEICKAVEAGYAFSVSIDGLEVVSRTDRLSHFNDFMLYDMNCESIVLFLIDRGEFSDARKIILKSSAENSNEEPNEKENLQTQNRKTSKSKNF